MIEKLASECVAPNKHRLTDTIEQILTSTRELISRGEFNRLKFFQDSKLLFDFALSTVNLFNRRNGYAKIMEITVSFSF